MCRPSGKVQIPGRICPCKHRCLLTLGPLAWAGEGCRCEHAREEGSASRIGVWNPLSCHWTESSRGLPVPCLCPSAPSPPSLPPGCTISSHMNREPGPGQTEMPPIAVTDDKKICRLKETVTLRGESTWGGGLGEFGLGELIFPGGRLQGRAVLGGGCRGLGPPWASALARPGAPPPGQPSLSGECRLPVLSPSHLCTPQ